MDAALFIAQFHINRRLKNIQKLYKILFAIYIYICRLFIWDSIPFLYFTNIKMTKTMTINGTDYEVKKFTIPCGLCSFWSLYDKPSQTKIEIYEDRLKSLNSIYGCVGSKFAFTIYGNVKDEKTGQLYDVRISKDHNYLM